MKRILLGLTVGVSFAFVTVSATARDLDGRYADSPLHDWFNHLAGLAPSSSGSQRFSSLGRQTAFRLPLIQRC
jgi:hypothetical protein